MQSASRSLAQNLRRRRLERAVSLSELARTAGISKATLSGIERGVGNPSVDTVWALAQALAIPFGDLFDDVGDDVIQVRRMQDAQIVAEEEGYVGRRLLSRQGRGGLELYVMDLDEGTKRDSKAHSPGVIEHVIIVSGCAEVGPVGEATELVEGDCMTFSADRPHSYRVVRGPVRLLSLTDYP